MIRLKLALMLDYLPDDGVEGSAEMVDSQLRAELSKKVAGIVRRGTLHLKNATLVQVAVGVDSMPIPDVEADDGEETVVPEKMRPDEHAQGCPRRRAGAQLVATCPCHMLVTVAADPPPALHVAGTAPETADEDETLECVKCGEQVIDGREDGYCSDLCEAEWNASELLMRHEEHAEGCSLRVDGSEFVPDCECQTDTAPGGAQGAKE